jgi:hypothetical protein
MRLFLWRGERPHYSLAKAEPCLDLQPLLKEPAFTVGGDAPPTLAWDLAVNVLDVTNQPGAEDVLFRRDDPAAETFHLGEGTRRGLISRPLPPFPRNDQHVLCARKPGEPWRPLGPVQRPQGVSDYPRQYRLSLDETGVVRLHAGEVPYHVSDNLEALRDHDGWVVRQELELRPRPTDEDRDPFCGKH